ncbi:MAG: transposase [Armatimonadetes bacterium]|nr:transposase [Armatimonadota bacterium]
MKRFVFAKEDCLACPRRQDCIRGKGLQRRITLHPQEAQLQAARALEGTEYFKEQYRDRVVVEHRLARLMGLGLRQARYVGRAKVLFQAQLTATVANLTLMMGKLAAGISPAADRDANFTPTALSEVWRRLRNLLVKRGGWETLLTRAERGNAYPRIFFSRTNLTFKITAFRPGF